MWNNLKIGILLSYGCGRVLLYFDDRYAAVVFMADNCCGVAEQYTVCDLSSGEGYTC